MERIDSVAPPAVGQDHPAAVRATVTLDLDAAAGRHDWASPRDVVFFVAVAPTANASHIMHLRAAEVVQVMDSLVVVNLDPVAYHADPTGVYDAMNLLVRRTGRENNFKPILESIRDLTLSSVPIPAWLQDVFLGYGDPAGATSHDDSGPLDFRDTFLDWNHLVQSFPGRVLEPCHTRPPYVLDFSHSDSVKVSGYQQPNTGPYAADVPKRNTVRFTPAQVEAIRAGTQPGLTVIVGPPGTGKTDVAVQIISNLYHNFPGQRTLLVTHSNQALNQLFQKIVALDIDHRHLLRLGHGEDELETDGDFSKYGRVESFLVRLSFVALPSLLSHLLGKSRSLSGGSRQTRSLSRCSGSPWQLL